MDARRASASVFSVASCCIGGGPGTVAVGSLVRGRFPAAHGAPGTRSSCRMLSYRSATQYRSLGSVITMSPPPSGRMVTAHRPVRRSSQWAPVTVPPVTTSSWALGNPVPVQTGSLNTMLKVKLPLPSWELGTLLNEAVSGCSDDRGVSFATSCSQFLLDVNTWLPAVSRRKAADGSVGGS